jgi:hypothetical protein
MFDEESYQTLAQIFLAEGETDPICKMFDEESYQTLAQIFLTEG